MNDCVFRYPINVCNKVCSIEKMNTCEKYLPNDSPQGNALSEKYDDCISDGLDSLYKDCKTPEDMFDLDEDAEEVYDQVNDRFREYFKNFTNKKNVRTIVDAFVHRGRKEDHGIGHLIVLYDHSQAEELMTYDFPLGSWHATGFLVGKTRSEAISFLKNSIQKNNLQVSYLAS